MQMSEAELEPEQIAEETDLSIKKIEAFWISVKKITNSNFKSYRFPHRTIFQDTAVGIF